MEQVGARPRISSTSSAGLKVAWRSGTPRARWRVPSWSKSGEPSDLLASPLGLKVAWRSGTPGSLAGSIVEQVGASPWISWLRRWD